MKVLIVDDEIVCQRKILEIMTEFADCNVVDSGNDALKAFNDAWAEGLPFDLIFLDISMPGISGIDVLTKIRETEKKKALSPENTAKVIMVTSHSKQDVVVGSVKAGCNSYIVKPFDRNKILDKLKALGFNPLRP